MQVQVVNLRDQINPQYLTPDVEKMLQIVGHTVRREYDDDLMDDDDYVGDITFEGGSDTFSVFIQNDNAWGAVVNMTVIGGHLIMIANYGDDGDVAYSFTIERGEHANFGWVNNITKDSVVLVQDF